MVDFSLSNAFSVAFNVIKNKFMSFLMIMIINITFTAGLTILLFKKLEALNFEDIKEVTDIFGKMFTGDVILYILVAIVIEIIINTHAITLVGNYLNDTDSSLKYTLKNIWFYIGGSLLLVLSIFGIMIVFLILAFIPLINILAFIGLFVLLIYFFGTFRFVPYYAFLERTFDELFSNVKKILTGKFWESILILIIFGIINFIINTSTNGLQTSLISNYRDSQTLNITNFNITAYIIIQSISIFVALFSVLVDVSFIGLGIKELKFINRKAYESKMEDTFSYDIDNPNNNE